MKKVFLALFAVVGIALLDTDRVSQEWTTENGIYGRKFIDKFSHKSGLCVRVVAE